jgi:hypothetical protein
MRTYWLHILESKSPQVGMPSTYLLVRADAPERNAEDGTMPTVHYHSWEQLSPRLSDIGMDASVLQDTKENLDSKGRHIIPEAILSDEQLKQLGFVDVAA